MTITWLDLETFSTIPIKHGVHRYAERAEIMLFAYAFDDGPVNLWDVTQDDTPPADLVAALTDPATLIAAHNSAFDRTILRHCLPDLCPPIERWRDTMVMALAHSLPAGLGQLCEVLRIPTDQAKDKAGKRLIQLFCQPRPKNVKLRRATAETHPIEWSRFCDYAKTDIEAMRECYKRIPVWNSTQAELDLWHLDQHINDRGVAIDLDLAHAAVRATDREQARLADLTHEMTEGAVAAATQRDALLRHILATYGIDLPDLQKATVERLLASDQLPQPVIDLLSIRLSASSTSTAKYEALINSTSSDGRLRGTIQFCGASRSGRAAGRIFQPQNLPRPTLKQPAIDQGIDALKADCEDILLDDVMELLSSAIRGAIVAPPGQKLVVADLNAIEGRVLAWLAGEEWKVQAYIEGQDLYKATYSKTFNIPIEEVTSGQRQIGKTMELAMGYSGGVGAFNTFAQGFGIDLEGLAIEALPHIPQDVYKACEKTREWARSRKMPDFGLSDRAWTVCDAFKVLWRQAHPKVVSLWTDTENTAKQAVRNPEKQFDTPQGLLMQRHKNWLRIRLQSGRYLSYPDVDIDNEALSYAGVHQFTRKWTRISTYSGKLVENTVQAIARDVLFHGMRLAEAAGYQVVLHVHDELICETPDVPEFSAEGLSTLMSTNPPWALDLPLAAEGFETYRYRK